MPPIPVPRWHATPQAPEGGAPGGGGDDAPPPAPRGTEANPLTLDEVEDLFARLAEQSHIPFGLDSPFCSARAHEMRRIMAREGIDCRKVFNEPTLSADLQTTPPIVVRTSDGQTIRWQYHVAPHVAVRVGDEVQRMVIDPALFDRPVTIAEWQAAQQCERPRINDTPGATFQPGEGRDDEYEETDRLLQLAKDIAEGREPPPGAGGGAGDAPPVPPHLQPKAPPEEEDDTIVPGPGSADDDD